ncbi:hypothetical protein E4U42_003232 [Claviceps africana]|uniref:Required for respiratory growth protein 9, mitochondrial n=1 Tax=Claviceps africana TaxID=83212 RepID=A0A8K0NGZ6_9HYPO|nr:hypothetical protein E4U42_003232 [Claviceps africana]
MNCACSAAPWRKFIQGLAQVHNVPAVVAKSRLSALPTVSRAAAASCLTTRSNRSFGTTGIQRQEASASAAAEGDVPGGTTTGAAPAQHFAETAEQTTDQDDAVATESAAQATASSAQQAHLKETSTRDEGAVSGPGARETEQRSASSASMPALPANRSRAHRLGRGDDGHNDDQAAPSDQTDKPPPPRKQPWQIQKEALKEKFPEGWAPRKRLSPDALAGIRALNAQFPDVYTTKALADKFKVSPEAIRRVLKSKWTPSAEEEQERQERWFRRGKQVWERQAALGVKPPKKWRREGIVRGVDWHEKRERAVKWEREWEEREKNEERERRARARGWYERGEMGGDGARGGVGGGRGGGRGGGEGEGEGGRG